MIAPHEGRELKLMLAGEKPMAAFGDVVPLSGLILEGIIPENAFAPYVVQGRFLRFSQETKSVKDGKITRHVCFTQPNESWRAHAFLWLRKNMHEGLIPNDASCDIMIGRLLGYQESDIQEFITQ
jgi:hypothetical protein